MKHATLTKNVLEVIREGMMDIIKAEYRVIDSELSNYRKYSYPIDDLVSYIKNIGNNKMFYKSIKVKYESSGQGNIIVYISNSCMNHQYQCMAITFHVNDDVNIYEVMNRLSYAVIGSRYI